MLSVSSMIFESVLGIAEDSLRPLPKVDVDLARLRKAFSNNKEVKVGKSDKGQFKVTYKGYEYYICAYKVDPLYPDDYMLGAVQIKYKSPNGYDRNVGYYRVDADAETRKSTAAHYKSLMSDIMSRVKAETIRVETEKKYDQARKGMPTPISPFVY